jgi:hypothetical protein
VPARLGPFYVFEIAEALARQPGRLKFDRDEAHRIGDHMFGAFERGEFGPDEAVVCFGKPPKMGPIARAKEEAKRTGYEWIDIDPNLWYRAAALTYPAAKRYVESCGLASAPRLLGEWFSDAPRERPTPEKLDLWMGQTVTRGVKRADAIADCCKANGATSRAAAAAWDRLPESVKLKRGQRAAPRKSNS